MGFLAMPKKMEGAKISRFFVACRALLGLLKIGGGY